MLLKLENLKFSFLLKQPACDFGPGPARARPPGPLAQQPTIGPSNRPGVARPPFPHGPHSGPRAAQAPLAIGFRSDGRPAISADQNRQAPVLPPNPNHFHSLPSLSTTRRPPVVTGGGGGAAAGPLAGARARLYAGRHRRAAWCRCSGPECMHNSGTPASPCPTRRWCNAGEPAPQVAVPSGNNRRR